MYHYIFTATHPWIYFVLALPGGWAPGAQRREASQLRSAAQPSTQPGRGGGDASFEAGPRWWKQVSYLDVGSMYICCIYMLYEFIWYNYYMFIQTLTSAKCHQEWAWEPLPKKGFAAKTFSRQLVNSPLRISFFLANTVLGTEGRACVF